MNHPSAFWYPARSLGLAALRFRLELGTRPLGHVHLAARAVERGRRPAPVMGALAVSVAGDAVLLRRLADPSRMPDGWDLLARVLDTALWAGLEPSPVSMAGQMAINAQGAAVEAWFREGAGDRAVPVYGQPPSGGPGEGPHQRRTGVGAAVLRAGRLAAPILVPYVAGSLVRRRLGLRQNPVDLVWSVGMGAVSLLTARRRDRLQRAARETWEQSVTARLEVEGHAARSEVLSGANPAHDFKKVLLLLGAAGSAEAARAAREHGARPGDVLAAAVHGRPLRMAVRSLRVEPAELGRWWLDDDQVATVQEWVDALEQEAPDQADTVVRVEVVSPGVIDLALMGSTVRVSNTALVQSFRLDPTSPMFVMSALLRLSELLPAFRTLPPWAAVGSAVLDGVGAARFWRRPPEDPELGLMVGLVGASAALGLWGALSPQARSSSGEGSGHHAALPVAHGASLLLAVHWSRLTPSERRLLPAVLAGAALTSLVRSRTPLVTWLESATVLGQTLVATWRAADLVGVEEAVLLEYLDDEYRERVRLARHVAVSEELDRFEQEAHLASAALAQVGDELDESARSMVEREIAEVATWVADTRARLAEPVVAVRDIRV